MAENDFTFYDLLEKLKEDDSWEADPEVRKEIANGLVTALVGR